VRTKAVVAVLALAGAGLGATAPTPCDVETAYHCARVEADPDRASGRLLLLNSAHHSYVDLAEPRYLEFAYTQWLGAIADVVAPAGTPVGTLHLGGGGFTMPGYLTATRAGSRQRVLELDGQLVELDRARLGLRTGTDLAVEVGDARVNLARQATDGYDLVIGDAFGHLVVPWHLATRELATDIGRTLRPGGIYAQNVIDYPPAEFIRAEVATVADVFPHVALVAPSAALAGEIGANFVIVASDTPLPLEALGSRLNVTADEPVVLLSGAELDTFVGGAGVLTDDYAPVDQLLTG
jgi:spermidine synthase